MIVIFSIILLITLSFAIILFQRSKSSLLIILFLPVILFLIYFPPLSLGSQSEIETRSAFELFFNGTLEYRDNNRKKLQIKVNQFVSQEVNTPGEVYLLAKRLKLIEEYQVAEIAYEYLFKNHLEMMDGDILSEYSQVLYFVSDRNFTDQVDKVLTKALSKNPLNPTALTLRGLQFFQERDLQAALTEWEKAIKYITNKDERVQLEEAVKALNKIKNQ